MPITSTTTLDLTSVPEAEYDPLEFIEGEDTEDWLEQDTSVLLPKPLPPSEAGHRPTRVSTYSPECAGGVVNAVRNLVTTNAGRRHILLSILDWAREGIDADDLFERIEAEAADNLSVYSPMAYCKMLERAGALVLETPEVPVSERPAEVAEPHASGSASATETPLLPSDAASGDVSYLSIEGDASPLWRSTPDGLEAYDELTQGTEWREKVLGTDAVYAEVYLAVMDAMLDGGRPKAELVELAETFEVTHNPRRYGAHFIDILEATQAIRWAGSLWNLTDLGRSLLPELEAYCAQ